MAQRLRRGANDVAESTRFPKNPKDEGSGSNHFNPPAVAHSPHSALAHLLPHNRKILGASPSHTLLQSHYNRSASSIESKHSQIKSDLNHGEGWEET